MKEPIASKILVTSKGDTFRRAGITFTLEPTELDIQEIGEERLDALLREPQLMVGFVADEDDDAKGKKAAAEKAAAEKKAPAAKADAKKS